MFSAHLKDCLAEKLREEASSHMVLVSSVLPVHVIGALPTRVLFSLRREEEFKSHWMGSTDYIDGVSHADVDSDFSFGVDPLTLRAFEEKETNHRSFPEVHWRHRDLDVFFTYTSHWRHAAQQQDMHFSSFVARYR